MLAEPCSQQRILVFFKAYHQMLNKAHNIAVIGAYCLDGEGTGCQAHTFTVQYIYTVENSAHVAKMLTGHTLGNATIFVHPSCKNATLAERKTLLLQLSSHHFKPRSSISRYRKVGFNFQQVPSLVVPTSFQVVALWTCWARSCCPICCIGQQTFQKGSTPPTSFHNFLGSNYLNLSVLCFRTI